MSCHDETKYCGLPLGNPCDSLEMQKYFNKLLKQIDEKLHEVELLTSDYDDKTKVKIVNDITKIKCEIICIKTQLEEFHCSIKANTFSIGDIRQELQKQSMRIDNVGNLAIQLSGEIFDNIKPRLVDVEERVTKLEDGVADITKRMSEVETFVSETIIEIGDRTSAVEATVKELAGIVAEFTQIVDEVKQSFYDFKSDVEERLSIDEENIHNNSELLKNHGTRLDAVEEQIAGLNEEDAATTIILNQHTEMLKDNGERISVLEEDVDKSKEVIQGHTTRLDTVENRITTLEEKNVTTTEIIIQHTDKIEQVNTDLNTLSAAYDKTVDTLDSAIEDLDAVKEMISENIWNVTSHSPFDIYTNDYLKLATLVCSSLNAPFTFNAPATVYYDLPVPKRNISFPVYFTEINTTTLEPGVIALAPTTNGVRISLSKFTPNSSQALTIVSNGTYVLVGTVTYPYI